MDFVILVYDSLLNGKRCCKLWVHEEETEKKGEKKGEIIEGEREGEIDR